MKYINSPATACVGKVKHSSYHVAYRSIAKQKKIRGDGPMKVKPYKCDYCGFWHIGHTLKRKGSKPTSQTNM